MPTPLPQQRHGTPPPASHTRDQLVDAGTRAAHRWCQTQTGYLTPLQLLHGQVEAAIGHLLATGMITPAQAPSSGEGQE